MQIVGVTGGTGSGKSEAGKHFASLGFPVIDADALGHALVEPGGALESDVIQKFGHAVSTDGHVDRKKLGALVFTDPGLRAQLNALIHPAIRASVADQCAVFAQQGHKTVLVDAALLAEHGTKQPYLDRLILVLAPVSTRLQRLIEHRGMTEAAARLQIDAQTPPEHKRPLADWVIENDGDIPSLHRQVEQIARELRRREER